MTEPPRPAGDPGDDPNKPAGYTIPGGTPEQSGAAPTSGGYSMPGSGGDYGPPPTDQGGYGTPSAPASGGGYTPPAAPASGGGYAAPASDYTAQSGGAFPPPTGGQSYPPPTGGQSFPPSSGGPAYPDTGAYSQSTSGAGAYGAPGPGAYPPPGGPQPGQPGYGGYGQQAYAGTPDEKNMIMVAHWGGVAGVLIGGALFGWVGPLIAYLAKGNTSPLVRAHALATLNFHITWVGINAIAWVITICTLFFASPLLILTGIACLVISIIGAVKATNGEYWNYPLTIPIIK
ncbi:DUF4870 domain-containing protein [Virgisporangium aliadipatigenens]|nr:DUF4870 domain-containing protein [Virgisporangium aliadipatigenens]